jgi:hypothetical protein
MIFTGCFMTRCQQEDPIVDVIALRIKGRIWLHGLLANTIFAGNSTFGSAQYKSG